MLDLLDDEQRAGLAVTPKIDIDNIPLVRQELSEMLVGVPALIAAAYPQIRIDDVSIDGPDGTPLRLRTYRRADTPGASAILYWMHGGGMVLGTPEMDDAFCSGVADMTGCIVVAPDYRLAPEHPFPAPFDDCYAGLLWTRDHAADLGVTSGKIVVGGASAGGGLAAALSLKARDSGDVGITAQFLNYPMLDDRSDSPSSHAYAEAPAWSRRQNLFGWHSYLGDAAETDSVSPYAAPARATNLKGLPPTYIAVGELDIFRDEDVDFARRLWAEGVSTELHVLPRSIHAAELFAPTSPVCQRWLALQTSMLTNLLS